MMKQRIDCLSLPTDDLGRVITFYRDGLGWPMEDIGRDADHIALTLHGGSYLVFIQRPEFASFTEIAKLETAPRGASGCILSYFAASRDEVDDILRRAAKAGASVAPASERAWGYAGFFADPDSHLWEVMWNPGISKQQEG
jgi:predicted lactoylglutathione lyase